LSIKNNNKKGSTNPAHPSKDDSPLDKKLDERIELLSKSDVNIDHAKEFQQRFNKSIKKQEAHNEKTKREEPKLEENKQVANNALSKDITDEFGIFLSNNQFESKVSKVNLKTERSRKIVLLCTSIIMIIVGFLIFIVPGPAFLENHAIAGNFTFASFMALLIIFFGVYLLISTINRDPLNLKK